MNGRKHAGYDGLKLNQKSMLHPAVDTLGHLLTPSVTPASEQHRAAMGELTRAVQEVTGGSVKVVFVDQDYTGKEPNEVAESYGIE